MAEQIPEMVERVARAIFTAGGTAPGIRQYDDLSVAMKISWYDSARAAIAALREPTEAMCDECGGFAIHELETAELWRAMIDAALGHQ